MPGATPAVFRSSVGGYAKFGIEAALLSSVATAIDVAPALGLCGICDLPTISDPNNAQVVHTVGSRQGVDTVLGGREPSANLNLRMGSAAFLMHGLQSSGLGTLYGLPELAFGGGHITDFGAGRVLAWLLRHGMINSVSLQFQEGQLVTATVEIWGTVLTLNAANQSVTQSELEALPKALTWGHTYFTIGGVSYRDVISSVSLQWSNGLIREGERNELGHNNDLSRTTYQILPGVETVNVSYTLKQQLPDSLIKSSLNARNWGPIRLSATDAAIGGTNEMAVDITNNLLGNQTMNGVQPGQKFSFTANTTSRVISISDSLT
jgi:hypothetical protein